MEHCRQLWEASPGSAAFGGTAQHWASLSAAVGSSAEGPGPRPRCVAPQEQGSRATFEVRVGIRVHHLESLCLRQTQDTPSGLGKFPNLGLLGAGRCLSSGQRWSCGPLSSASPPCTRWSADRLVGPAQVPVCGRWDSVQLRPVLRGETGAHAVCSVGAAIRACHHTQMHACVHAQSVWQLCRGRLRAPGRLSCAGLQLFIHTDSKHIAVPGQRGPHGGRTQQV